MKSTISNAFTNSWNNFLGFLTPEFLLQAHELTERYKKEGQAGAPLPADLKKTLPELRAELKKTVASLAASRRKNANGAEQNQQKKLQKREKQLLAAIELDIISRRMEGQFFYALAELCRLMEITEHETNPEAKRVGITTRGEFLDLAKSHFTRLIEANIRVLQPSLEQLRFFAPLSASVYLSVQNNEPNVVCDMIRAPVLEMLAECFTLFAAETSHFHDGLSPSDVQADEMFFVPEKALRRFSELFYDLADEHGFIKWAEKYLEDLCRYVIATPCMDMSHDRHRVVSDLILFIQQQLLGDAERQTSVVERVFAIINFANQLDIKKGLLHRLMVRNHRVIPCRLGKKASDELQYFLSSELFRQLKEQSKGHALYRAESKALKDIIEEAKRAHRSMVAIEHPQRTETKKPQVDRATELNEHTLQDETQKQQQLVSTIERRWRARQSTHKATAGELSARVDSFDTSELSSAANSISDQPQGSPQASSSTSISKPLQLSGEVSPLSVSGSSEAAGNNASGSQSQLEQHHLEITNVRAAYTVHSAHLDAQATALETSSIEKRLRCIPLRAVTEHLNSVNQNRPPSLGRLVMTWLLQLFSPMPKSLRSSLERDGFHATNLYRRHELANPDAFANSWNNFLGFLTPEFIQLTKELTEQHKQASTAGLLAPDDLKKTLSELRIDLKNTHSSLARQNTNHLTSNEQAQREKNEKREKQLLVAIELELKSRNLQGQFWYALAELCHMVEINDRGALEEYRNVDTPTRGGFADLEKRHFSTLIAIHLHKLQPSLEQLRLYVPLAALFCSSEKSGEPNTVCNMMHTPVLRKVAECFTLLGAQPSHFASRSSPDRVKAEEVFFVSEKSPEQFLGLFDRLADENSLVEWAEKYLQDLCFYVITTPRIDITHDRHRVVKQLIYFIKQQLLGDVERQLSVVERVCAIIEFANQLDVKKGLLHQTMLRNHRVIPYRLGKSGADELQYFRSSQLFSQLRKQSRGHAYYRAEADALNQLIREEAQRNAITVEQLQQATPQKQYEVASAIDQRWRENHASEKAVAKQALNSAANKPSSATSSTSEQPRICQASSSSSSRSQSQPEPDFSTGPTRIRAYLEHKAHLERQATALENASILNRLDDIPLIAVTERLNKITQNGQPNKVSRVANWVIQHFSPMPKTFGTSLARYGFLATNNYRRPKPGSPAVNVNGVASLNAVKPK